MRNLFWIFFVVFSYSVSAQMEINGEILYGNEWIDYDKTYIKITVDQDGIYRVSQAELIAEGVPLNQLTLNNLFLYHLGNSIPFYADPDGNYIEFYGQKNRSELDRFIYEDENSILNPEYSVVSDVSAYFLTWDETINPLQMTETVTDLSSNNLSPESFYMHTEKVVITTKHYKPVRDNENIRFSNFVPSEGYGSGVNVVNTVEVPISEVVENGSVASAKVRFGGNGLTFHKTTVHINGIPRDTHNHSLNEIVELSYPLNNDDLSGASVDIQLTGISTPDKDKNILSIGEVTYPRAFELNPGSLSHIFHLEASPTQRYIEVGGYAMSDVPLIYDLGRNVRILPEVTSGNKIGFLLPANTESSSIFLTSSEQGILSPLEIKQRQFIDYNNPDYNYIILTNEELRSQDNVDWVEEYANYRASMEGGGYIPLIANVDQLYDQFAYGIDRHFIAFRNFGFWTEENFTDPLFMFIIGKGREYNRTRTELFIENFGEGYVPTWGTPGSDNIILSGDDIPLPLYPIGRLAAKNIQEVKDYLDKVKEHDLNMSLPQTVKDRLWQKRVLHLSGGDATLQEALARNLQVMGDTLTNNTFGADVTTFYKTSVEAIEVAVSDRIFDLINNGLSVITFFGHSSVGKFDFSIDNIDSYFNKGKYPLVFSLGCYSGNIHTSIEGISEQFIVRKDKGAVCFIAASGTAYVGQQYQYGLRYYERLGGEDYGKPIGTVLNNVIEEFSPIDQYSYVTFLQQLTLHGDPAVRLASFETADILPDASSVKTNPTFVDTYEDDFELCFDVANIGRSVGGEYDILIEHFDPSGELVTDTMIRREVPKFKEQYCLKMPITSNKLVGKNLIKITVDASDEIDESPIPSAELNNRLIAENGTEGFEFFILNNSAIPIYPKEFAIVNENDFSLLASTYNALGEDQKFIVQLDSTEQFNSPLLLEAELSNIKGVIEWSPNLQFTPGKVYYWRISPDSTTTGVGYVWSESSFIYDPESRDGWNQSHYYQYLKDEFENMSLRSDRRFYFAENLKEVVIANKVWENDLPAQFIIDSDAKSSMMHRSTAPSFGVAVVDTLGRFVMNPIGGAYGSLNLNTKAIRTFYFKTDDQEKRIAMIDFLEDIVPDGYYVCIYNVFRDNNTNFKVPEWQADSLVNNGINIFNYLEAQGAIDIRKMQDAGIALPYGFIYQKGISPLAEGIAEERSGSIDVQEDLPGFWFEGSLKSDFIGPAKSWDEVEWSVRSSTVSASDTTYINLYGYDKNRGNEQLLITREEANNFNIQSIDAETFPYLRLEFYANDFDEVSPAQVERLRVYYQGYGDVALNTTQNYSFYADSLQQGDVLKMVYDISNFSDQDISEVAVEYRIIDENNEVIRETRSLPSLKAKESKPVEFTYNTRELLGEYQFQVEVNPSQTRTEEYYFNNFGLEEFKVTPDKINPLLNVTFDGVTIMDQDIVSSNPLISIELRDENPYILLESPENFSILLEPPGGEVKQITIDDPELDFYPAQEDINNTARMEYNPELLVDGEYTLTIEARDESSNSSGDKNYEVRFRVYNEEMVSNVFNYPNPFSTSTQFIFTLTGNEEPGNVLIRIMTLSGKVVREITSAELGPLRIGMNRTEFKWDGRDEFGDKLGNGTYLYQVITKKMDGSDYKHFSDPTQNNTDYLFKNGFGKLVIMR